MCLIENRIFTIIGLSLTLSLQSSVLMAQGSGTKHLIRPEQTLGLLENVGIIIDDQVKDGCWTNINAIKNKISSKLEQADINTFDEDLGNLYGFSSNLVAQGLGYKATSDLCVGYFDYYLEFVSNYEFPVSSDVDTWSVHFTSKSYSYSALLSGPINLNEQFLDNADSATDKLITMVYKNKKISVVEDLKGNVSLMNKAVMTQSEIDEIFDN